ncbi:carbohydrate esterase family 5 protein, partial [Dothistroma septosporum NZE10]
GAHIIVARASLEVLGYGIIGAVKDNVLKAVPGSTAEYVVYPATLTDYFNSESDGVVAMRKLIDAYVAKCANAPLVLMGYSQGAQVTADSLVGQQVVAFPANSSVDQPLPDSTLQSVAAVVMMGDPSSNLTESFHVGNATKNGIFPRKNVASFADTGLASRAKSYCDAGDPYCASGNFSMLSVHLGYVQEYGSAATTFVV